MISDLLKKYDGKDIGINFDEPTKFKEAKLIRVTNEYFSISVKEKGLRFSYPYTCIMSVIEGDSGGVAMGFFSKKFPVVIQVNHLIVYKGGTGFGFSF